MAPGIKLNRWRSYIRDLKRLLRPNGWVQLVEYYYIIQSHSGLLTSNHSLQQWSDGYRAAIDGERDPRVGRNLGQMLRTAGFDSVEERTFHVPIGSWPSGASLSFATCCCPCIVLNFGLSSSLILTFYGVPFINSCTEVSCVFSQWVSSFTALPTHSTQYLGIIFI